MRSGATEFHYERRRQPLPRIGPWRDELDRMLAGERGQAGARAADLDPDLRGAARAGLRGRLRRGPPLCQGMAGGARGGDGGSLCAAELCPGRGLPVRLVTRDRADQRGDGDGQGGACPAVPQPHAVRAGLSARDPGDGVRRAQPRLRLLSRAPARAASTTT